MKATAATLPIRALAANSAGVPVTKISFRKRAGRLALAVSMLVCGAATAVAQQEAKSFRDDFDKLDRSRWYVADGWANGEHQNCTWSKDQLKLDGGILTLSFEKRPYKQRDYSCAEIQTTKRFGYGTYEARFKTDVGSGINAAFFTFIGPTDGQPHDEIDFEVLTKDTSKVSVNTYVGGKPRNGSVVDVSGGTDAGYNDYAFVWEENRLRWYVNGELQHEAASPAELPTHPQKIFFSLWGTDTLSDWMGSFEEPDRKLTMEVDWVAFTALGDECQFPESVACKLQ